MLLPKSIQGSSECIVVPIYLIMKLICYQPFKLIIRAVVRRMLDSYFLLHIRSEFGARVGISYLNKLMKICNSSISPDSAFTEYNARIRILCKITVWRGITDILHVT